MPLSLIVTVTAFAEHAAKESAKQQHEVDKANFEAAKAEADPEFCTVCLPGQPKVSEIVGELDPKTTTVSEMGLYIAGAKRDTKGGDNA